MADEAKVPLPSAGGDHFVLLTVIIKPFRLDTVLTALRPFHAVSVTVSEVRGYGRQKGHLELYRGSEYVISFVPKLKLEIVAQSGEVEEIVQAVATAARTGRIGDGKIFFERLSGMHSDEPVPLS